MLVANSEEIEGRKRYIQFVIKVSKFCNLRCKYCYEFPHLGDKTRMAREQCAIIYERALDFLTKLDFAVGEVHFIWHGGEPLLLPCEFFRDTFNDQSRIIGNAFRYKNLVQTNLTVLDDCRLDLLRCGFDHVGVSIDLFGGLRVNLRGLAQDEKIVENMERLLEGGIQFGAITVLNSTNVDNVEDIFDFFDEFRIPFRLHSLHASLVQGQTDPFALSASQTVRAFQRIFEKWLAAEKPVYVEPIVDYVLIAAQFITGEYRPRVFNKRDWINTLIVDTDGEVYSYSDPYEDKSWSYGNLFDSPIGQLLSSKAFERSCYEADKRIAANCLDCRFFGACSGYPIADGPSDETQFHEIGIRKCVIEKEFFEYLENRLRQLKAASETEGAAAARGWKRVQDLLRNGESIEYAMAL